MLTAIASAVAMALIDRSMPSRRGDSTDNSDILIIATRGAVVRTPDDRIFQCPMLHAELKRVGIQSIADTQLRKIGDNLAIGPYVRMGEIAQARSLLQAQWNRFNHAGQFDLPMRELLALTQSAGTEALARTTP